MLYIISIILDLHFPSICYRKLLSPPVVPANNSARVGVVKNFNLDDLAQFMPVRIYDAISLASVCIIIVLKLILRHCPRNGAIPECCKPSISQSTCQTADASVFLKGLNPSSLPFSNGTHGLIYLIRILGTAEVASLRIALANTRRNWLMQLPHLSLSLWLCAVANFNFWLSRTSVSQVEHIYIAANVVSGFSIYTARLIQSSLAFDTLYVLINRSPRPTIQLYVKVACCVDVCRYELFGWWQQSRTGLNCLLFAR